MIEIPIHKAIIKHIEEMAASDKVTPIKPNNRLRVLYDNGWIAGVEYEDIEGKKRIKAKKIRKTKTIQK